MVNDASLEGLDASIATFNASHPKWSYAKVDDDGYVSEVAEKKVISNDATVGIYYYRQGRFFVNAAKRMIRKNIRVNGEFYVCPVFNQMIDKRQKVGIYPVRKMQGLGTPEDLARYLDEQQ
jgi:dTDP-glucose pyrophosphorylase